MTDFFVAVFFFGFVGYPYYYLRMSRDSVPSKCGINFRRFGTNFGLKYVFFGGK